MHRAGRKPAGPASFAPEVREEPGHKGHQTEIRAHAMRPCTAEMWRRGGYHPPVCGAARGAGCREGGARGGTARGYPHLAGTRQVLLFAKELPNRGQPPHCPFVGAAISRPWAHAMRPYMAEMWRRGGYHPPVCGAARGAGCREGGARGGTARGYPHLAGTRQVLLFAKELPNRGQPPHCPFVGAAISRPWAHAMRPCTAAGVGAGADLIRPSIINVQEKE